MVAANQIKHRQSPLDFLIASVLFAIARKQPDREELILDAVSKLLDEAFYNNFTKTHHFDQMKSVVVLCADLISSFKDTSEKQISAFTRKLLLHAAKAHTTAGKVGMTNYLNYFDSVICGASSLLLRLKNDKPLVTLATLIECLSDRMIHGSYNRGQFAKVLAEQDMRIEHELTVLSKDIGLLPIMRKLGRFVSDHVEPSCQSNTIAWLWRCWLFREHYGPSIKINWLHGFNEESFEKCLAVEFHQEILQQIETSICEHWTLYEAEIFLKNCRALGYPSRPLTKAVVDRILEVVIDNSKNFRAIEITCARSIASEFGGPATVRRFDCFYKEYMR